MPFLVSAARRVELMYTSAKMRVHAARKRPIDSVLCDQHDVANAVDEAWLEMQRSRRCEERSRLLITSPDYH